MENNGNNQYRKNNENDQYGENNGNGSSAREQERLRQALTELKTWAGELSREAGWSRERLEEFWKGLCETEGMLREFAYYHDTGELLCEKQVAGYTVADITAWQVDHFKAYMDRESLRYNSAGLLLSSLETMIKMEKEPAGYVEKLRQESGTDRENPQC